MQAMAQTQAAQATAAQAAATQTLAQQVADPATTATSDDASAAIGGKAGSASDASEAKSTTSLAFMSQSLAAAIAGAQQQPNAAQATGANGASAAGSSDEDDSVEAVSANGGASSAAQGLAATLTKETADALKSATDPASGSGGSKGDPGANSAPGADGTSAAVSAFQAHLSVGSHFQQVAATDSNANKVNSPVGSPAWNDEFGGKVTWLANQGIQSASVQLSPEHLGPVSVHISVQDGSASVSFTAAHADTRAALEQALPRLREMFATNGLTLSDANVSHQSPRGQAQKQSISAIGGIRGGSGEDATSSTVTPVVTNRLGLVDTYA
jgi:flagellar hook-length control protein FliK